MRTATSKYYQSLLILPNILAENAYHLKTAAKVIIFFQLPLHKIKNNFFES